jgi:hypothetical protein
VLHDGDEPDAVPDLRDVDVLSGEGVTQIDFPSLKTAAAARVMVSVDAGDSGLDDGKAKAPFRDADRRTALVLPVVSLSRTLMLRSRHG